MEVQQENGMIRTMFYSMDSHRYSGTIIHRRTDITIRQIIIPIPHFILLRLMEEPEILKEFSNRHHYQ